MKCPKCQTENPSDANFCIECATPMEFHCPKCGAITPATGKFCKVCAHDLIEAKAAPPIDYSQPLSYVPKHLADKIFSARSSVEGERKQVTVLFADVKGFTSISEKMDPEEVQTLISGCLAFFTEEIHRYEGTIAQFLGDGVMALFGAPIAHEDAPQRALYAALAIQQHLKDYGDKLKKHGIDFNMRIGLNSGLVVLGRIGDDLTMEYTAMGDTVNLASRMEIMAEPGTIQVAENTYHLTEGYFDFQPLGEVVVKGKEEMVKAYRVLGLGTARTRIGASIARGLTPFIGRGREIDHLANRFEMVKEGQCQVVSITGEAGVGKSRLLLEFIQSLPTNEYTYLEGGCMHYGGTIAYQPLIEILRSYFGIRDEDQESVIKKKMAEKIDRLDERLSDILPPLHEILSLEVEHEGYLKLDAQDRRVKAFEAIRELLVLESRNRPLIITIEDLHWIDRTSEDFLTYLITGLSNTHILLVLLYRPEYTYHWASKSYYSQISVGQLSTRISAELVQSILEEGEAVPELRELILSKAGGNPLFVEEVTHTLLENGSIQRKDHQFVLSRKASDIQVPDTIQGIIAARMDHLDESLKRIMQVASVIGREFAFRILQTIMEMREELKSCLLNLQELEFIYEKSLFPELEYIFKHALTQEVAYNSLLLKRRKEIHQRIGKAIEELYPDRLEEFYEILAFHFKQGESYDKALDYLIKSGEKSCDRYAVEESHLHFKEAYNILSHKAGRTKNEDALLIDLLLKWAYVFYFRGDFIGMTDVFSANQDLAESLGDKARLGMFYGWLGYTVFCRERYKDSYQYMIKALKLGDEIGDQRVIGYACTFLTWSCASLGLLDEAIAYVERAQEISRSLQTDQYLYLKSMGGIGMAYFYKGEMKKAFAAGEALLEYGHSHGSIRCLPPGYMIMAQGHLLDGDFSSAIECSRQGIEVSTEPCANYMMRMLLGISYTTSGQFQEAKDTLQQLITDCEKFHADSYVKTSNLYLGAVLMVEGRMAQGMKIIEEVQRSYKENGVKPLYAQSEYLLGRIYLQMVEKAEPVKLTTVLRNIGFLVKNVPFAGKKAEKHFNKAIEVFREIEAKGWTGQAYLGLGLLYNAKGEKARAREYISNAIELFEQCELENSLRQAQEALASLE